MDNEFADESPKKGTSFYLVLAVLLLFSLMGMGIDFDEFSQKHSLNIPDWYFYVVFFVDFLLVAALVLIYFYRKAGVILFPAVLVTHFFLHNFFLSTFLYTDVTNLFLYVTFGLLVFIPKWQFFK